MQDLEAVARRFYAAFQPGNTAALHTALAPDWVDHTLPPYGGPGVPGIEAALLQLHSLVPDLKTTVVKLLTDNDTIAVHIVFEGTHKTKAIRFIAFDMHRIANGNIVESWHLEDNLSFLSQIG